MSNEVDGQNGLETLEASGSHFAVTVSHSGQVVALPSFLHGWRFLTMLKSDDDEAIAFKASAANAGPTIIFNPAFVTPEELESPAKALIWLCSAMTHISYSVLIECLYTGEDMGRFSSKAWDDFRNAICQHTGMGWDEIITAAKREGVDFMSEHMAACLIAESGLQDLLIQRGHGEKALRIA